jgi:hypothetical protein
MADGQLIGTSFSVNIANNFLEKNKKIKCQCCVTLKVYLQAAKQEISSYREIIKILLEEQSMTQQQQLKLDEPRSEEELFHPISRGALMETTARAGIRQSNLIQIIPTANKFEILAKINDK